MALNWQPEMDEIKRRVVMANDLQRGGGAIDVNASEKMIRFVDLCDTFHLPVVNFVNNPGFLIGPTGRASLALSNA